MVELYEVEKVKIEFLQSIAEEYGQVFSERQLEMSVYMLNEFCALCTSNSLAFIRVPDEEPVQQYAQPPQENPFDNIPELPRPQVQRQVQEMNNQLQQPVVHDVDLSTSDKPKTFQDKIREMRMAPKKQPGQLVNPGDD